MAKGDAYSPYKIFEGIFIPNSLVSYSGIGHGEKICLGRLHRYCLRKTYCWPSQEELATELGVSVRTVHEYISNLEGAGFIRVIQRGLGMPNVYEMIENEVLFPHLEDGYYQKNPGYPDRQDSSDQETRDISGQEPKNSSDQEARDPAGPTYNTERSQRKRVIKPIGNKKINLDPDPNTDTHTDNNLPPRENNLPWRKSKIQTRNSSSLFWTNEDRRSFSSRFKSIPKSKLNGGKERMVISFLENEGVDLDQAIDAVEGFKNNSADPSVEAFMSRFYTWKDFGSRAQQDEPVRKKVANHVARPAVALERAQTPQKQVFSPEQAIEKWNSMVPSGKIVDWDPARDDYSKLKKLCLDPDFVDKLPSVCAKAEAIHKAVSGWAPTFRWLISKKGNVENWWKLHTGELDGMTKKRSSSGASKAQDEQRERVKKMLMGEIK